uniref:Uncharacterized protein n=1 Tax=Avena sativa TaxID=4498 RepID=A0ACD5VI73_AVESA
MSGVATSTRGNEEHGVVEREADFRAWLLLLMSLTATVSYAAGFAPPGGVWNDSADGHVAGTPVWRDRFAVRYLVFYYSNTAAFFSSLLVIAMLAKPNKSKRQRHIFYSIVVVCFMSLCCSYMAGTSVDVGSTMLNLIFIAVFVLIMIVFTLKQNLPMSCP